MCCGDCEVELLLPPDDGSPKLHCHEAAPPRDASSNSTVWPATGEDGVNEKSAVNVWPGAPITRSTARGSWPTMKRLLLGLPATNGVSSEPFTVTIAPRKYSPDGTPAGTDCS